MSLPETDFFTNNMSILQKLGTALYPWNIFNNGRITTPFLDPCAIPFPRWNVLAIKVEEIFAVNNVFKTSS